jgi:hypothetical protein
MAEKLNLPAAYRWQLQSGKHDFVRVLGDVPLEQRDIFVHVQLHQINTTQGQDWLVKYIHRVMKTIYSGNNRTEANLIGCVQAIRKKWKKKFRREGVAVLLGKEDVEQILKSHSSGVHHEYRFCNLMVAICSEPWLIDEKLGHSGVCYFGGCDLASNIKRVLIANNFF